MDHKTGFTYATTIKSKSHERILPACDAVAGYLKAPIVTFATDRESSISKSKIFLHARRFDLQQTSPYVHEKVAERKVRTIRNGMRTILADLPYALPLMLYVHLFSWVAFMQNILPQGWPGHFFLKRVSFTRNQIRSESTGNQLSAVSYPDIFVFAIAGAQPVQCRLQFSQHLATCLSQIQKNSKKII